jgi:hypothetical protein
MVAALTGTHPRQPQAVRPAGVQVISAVGPLLAAVPYSAPHTESACADNNPLMNVVSMSRIKSGLACASSSCRKRAGSILRCSGYRGAPIRVGCERSLEGSRGDRVNLSRTRSPPSSYTTLPDSTNTRPSASRACSTALWSGWRRRVAWPLERRERPREAAASMRWLGPPVL